LNDPTQNQRRAVALIDPSNFSIPYDSHLMAALATTGWRAALYGRAIRETEDQVQSDVTFHAHFSRVAESAGARRVPRSITSAVKAAELGFDYLRLLRALRRSGTSIVHVQWLVLPMVDQHWLRAARRLWPVVMTVHDSAPFLGSPTSRFQRVGWREALDIPDALVVHTSQSKQAICSLGVPASRVNVIPHGLLRSQVALDQNAGDLPYLNRSKILCTLVGHLKPYKGIDILLRAVALLPEDVRSRLQVVIAGKPADSPAVLESLVNILGIGDIVTLQQRFLPEAEMHALLERSSIVAFPYRAIDASGVFLSVAGMSKAVVATPIGVFEELISDRHTGILVNKEDAAGLANALTELVRDPELRTRLGAALCESVRKSLGWDNIAEMTRALYERLLQERGHRHCGRDGAVGWSAAS
jgi:glycosyltransferase involved in cell wall biosynthesis